MRFDFTIRFLEDKRLPRLLIGDGMVIETKSGIYREVLVFKASAISH